MGVKEKQTVKEEKDHVVDISSESAIKEKLAVMSNLGFNDVNLNMETLKKFNYDLDSSVNYLLDQTATSAVKDQVSKSKSKSLEPNNVNVSPQPGTSTSSIVDFPVRKAAATHGAPQMDECTICCNEYEITSTYWHVLQCSHKICVGCYKQIETTRTTMAGVNHTFIKCPFCLGTSGIEIGTCPNGTMTDQVVPSPCEGYSGYDSIGLTYQVQDVNYRLNRTAYLPDNNEGREVLQLLRIAWDRRLCFSIGTSNTSGLENVLVWNIHHKTSREGGVLRYGYPDPSYFERVKCELKVYGIE